MTETIEKITFNPHRGHLEPMGEVRKAEIKLSENHLELIYDYDFTDVLGVDDKRIAALFTHRKDLSFGLSTWYHEEDKDKRAYPRIEIYLNGSYCEYVYLETMEEAYGIYKRLKNWLTK